VQEVCPFNAVGRDEWGGCICDSDRQPIVVAGALASCELAGRQTILKDREKADMNTALNSPPPGHGEAGRGLDSWSKRQGTEALDSNGVTFVAEHTEVVGGLGEEPASLQATATTSQTLLQRLGIASTLPTTVTLLFLVAGALAYWLTKK